MILLSASTDALLAAADPAPAPGAGLGPADRLALGDTDRAFWQHMRARLAAALSLLPDKPDETVDSTLRTLWLLACGERWSCAAARDQVLRRMTPKERRRLDALVTQRLSGVPLAYLSGRQHFMGLEMISCPRALIPRRETEVLARAAIDLLQACAEFSPSSPLAIDVCTGSGPVAAAMAAAVPGARVLASDLCPDAISLAGENLRHLGLHDDVSLHVGDLLAPFDHAGFHGRVDVLTGNPPYIASGRVGRMPGEIVGHEPSLAFDGGPLGIRVLLRFIREAPRFLRPGGWALFEVGPGQGRAAAQRLRSAGRFDRIEELRDEHGVLRALKARLAPGHRTASDPAPAAPRFAFS